jgi:hypothetical protein
MSRAASSRHVDLGNDRLMVVVPPFSPMRHVDDAVLTAVQRMTQPELLPVTKHQDGIVRAVLSFFQFWLLAQRASSASPTRPRTGAITSTGTRKSNAAL